MARGGKRKGAGRKPGTTKADGMSTKVVRVSTELENQDYQNLPSLLAVLSHWEEELISAKLRGESVRTYDKLSLLLDDVKALGY